VGPFPPWLPSFRCRVSQSFSPLWRLPVSTTFPAEIRSMYGCACPSFPFRPFSPFFPFFFTYTPYTFAVVSPTLSPPSARSVISTLPPPCQRLSSDFFWLARRLRLLRRLLTWLVLLQELISRTWKTFFFLLTLCRTKDFSPSLRPSYRAMSRFFLLSLFEASREFPLFLMSYDSSVRYTFFFFLRVPSF